MSKVFWFTGRMASGKSTLTRKLEVYLKNKEKVHVIERDDFRIWNLNMWFLRFRKIKMPFIKKIVKQADLLSEKNVIVLVADPGSHSITDYAKGQLNERYREIYLKCSVECSIKRRFKSRITKRILNFIKNYYTFFEEPKLPNIIIDTEHQSVEESFQTLLHFLEKEQVSIHNKMS